jgi:ankyrin repeat protein
MISWLPIHCAAERGRYNSVRVLIENHSPVDPADKNQQTPLHLAARNGHSEVVKLLLKNGAKINSRTSNGDNCLDLAIGSNQYNVAETLINNRQWELILRNAKFDQQTNRWDTPLRKLIRKMPDIALIVLNKCCTVMKEKKYEQTSSENEEKKKKKDKKSNEINVIELEEHLNRNNAETSGLTKDETQLQKLTLVYIYEFLDDQFCLTSWQEGKGKLYFGL